MTAGRTPLYARVLVMLGISLLAITLMVLETRQSSRNSPATRYATVSSGLQPSAPSVTSVSALAFSSPTPDGPIVADDVLEAIDSPNLAAMVESANNSTEKVELPHSGSSGSVRPGADFSTASDLKRMFALGAALHEGAGSGPDYDYPTYRPGDGRALRRRGVIIDYHYPTNGAATLTATAAPLNYLADPTRGPVVEQLWSGLGGHRTGSGSTFPVIAILRAGRNPFYGWCQVSNGTTVWSSRVDLALHVPWRVEIDVPDSAGAGSYQWELVDGGTDTTIAEQDLSMGAHADAVYWLTPLPGKSISIPGFGYAQTIVPTPPQDSVSGAIPAVPPFMPLSSPTTNPAAGMRATAGSPPVLRWDRFTWDLVLSGHLDYNPSTVQLSGPMRVVSEDQAPTTAGGWAPASVVGVDPEVEHKLGGAALKGLLDWVRGGGTAVVGPDSVLLAYLEPAARLDHVNGSQAPVPFCVFWLGQGRLVQALPAHGRETASFLSSDVMSLASWYIAKIPSSRDDIASQILNLAQAPTLTVSTPRWPVILALGVAFAAIFGPFSLWLMKRVRRMLHVWLVVPALSLSLTFVTLLLGGRVVSRLRIFNTNSFAVIPSGASIGQEEAQQVFFTADPGVYSIDEGSLTLRDTTLQPNEGSIRDLAADGVHTVMLGSLPSYSSRCFSSAGPLQLDGALSIRLNANGSGEVANSTGHDVPPGALLAGIYMRRIPGVAPHQEYRFGADGWVESPASPRFESSGIVPETVSNLIGLNLAPLKGQVDSVVSTLTTRTARADACWIIPNGPWDALPQAQPGVGERDRVLVVTGEAPEKLRQVPASERREAAREKSTTARLRPQMTSWSVAESPYSGASASFALAAFDGIKLQIRLNGDTTGLLVNYGRVQAPAGYFVSRDYWAATPSLAPGQTYNLGRSAWRPISQVDSTPPVIRSCAREALRSFSLRPDRLSTPVRWVVPAVGSTVGDIATAPACAYSIAIDGPRMLTRRPGGARKGPSPAVTGQGTSGGSAPSMRSRRDAALSLDASPAPAHAGGN